MNIYEKLLKVQCELKAPKSQYNKFGNYNYRNCEDIQEAAKPLLKEVNAVLIITDEPVVIEQRYYIKAVVKFIDCEDGKELINSAYAREEGNKKGMDAAQVTGATSSYARKYALNGLLCIDDNKDADHPSDGQGEKPKSNSKTPSNKPAPDKVPLITKSHIAVIEKELERTGVGMEVVLKRYKIQKIDEMNMTDFKKAVDGLKKSKDKAPESSPKEPADIPDEIQEELPFK